MQCKLILRGKQKRAYGRLHMTMAQYKTVNNDTYNKTYWSISIVIIIKTKALFFKPNSSSKNKPAWYLDIYVDMVI